MADKTIEELQAELETLKKANLEAQIAKEKAKADEDMRLAVEHEKERMREEIRQEVLNESKITASKPAKMDSAKSDTETFSEEFVKSHNLSGNKYEQIVHKLAYKGFSK